MFEIIIIENHKVVEKYILSEPQMQKKASECFRLLLSGSIEDYILGGVNEELQYEVGDSFDAKSFYNEQT